MSSPTATELPGVASPAQPEPGVEPTHSGQPPSLRGRTARLIHGPEGDPAWARPALLILLGLTALLYLWQLGASGYANSFYAAAVQAGTVSWKAMFFGSLDGGNAITVDKPAFFLWPMEISGRLFGFNGWSMLIPQALEGVAAVGLLAATVRRISGHTAGLAAGTILAITPAATLMFKFNNPDAMLVLLLTGAAYALLRAIENATGTRWITLAGVLIGLGFITKMGQALLILPAFGLAYLWAAPTILRRRITDLLGATVAMIASAGWYVAIVGLWPTTSRPYIGGSTNNSLLELAFGYNGLGRLWGESHGQGAGGRAVPGGAQAAAGRNGGGMGGTGFGGSTGLHRLFSGDFATEISWLLPAALLALIAGLWLTRRAPRTDLTRAALLLFGGSLISTGLVFSFMQGTIHPYYSLALAPLIAAILAVTGRRLWLARSTWTARIVAAILLAVTAGWDTHLLMLTPTFVPALRHVVLLGGALGCLALLTTPWLRKAAVPALVVAGLIGLAGSTAYALDTTILKHSGSIPSAGPVISGMDGGMGRHQLTGLDAMPPGGFTGGPPSGGARPTAGNGSGPGPTGGGPGPTGADRAEPTADPAIVALLKATSTRWAAAAIGSQSAAPLQLGSGRPVMSIGGFNGGDDAPTLIQFQADVNSGQIRYFIVGGGGGANGGMGRSSGSGSQITTWVAARYTATTVGNLTVYDLTAAK